MRKFGECLLHIFASICLLTLLSMLSIFYDLEMFRALNSVDLNEISSDVNRVHTYFVAGLFFRYLAAIAAAVISFLLLRKTSKSYWIVGVVLAVSIIGSHLKVQHLFIYISFAEVISDEFYVRVIVNSLYLIVLASASYYLSYVVAMRGSQSDLVGNSSFEKL